MELLIAKGGSDVDRNYTTYFNDMSDEERDAERQTVPILFEDFSSRIKEENNGTRNSVCSHHLGISCYVNFLGHLGPSIKDVGIFLAIFDTPLPHAGISTLIYLTPTF